MPGVMKPTVLDTVHSSCKAVVDAQQQVTLEPDAIRTYAAQLDAAAVAAAQSKAGVVFPIKFDNQEAEITFLALYHLLDFGRGYDALLRASSSKRGWRDTLQYGCFGLALAATRLDGPWMRAFSLYTLHNAFGFDSKVEQQLQPGITISKPGPLAPLALAIHSTIVETGAALEAAGAKSLGGLILEHLDGLKAAGKPITAASLAEELADNIPGFQDTALFTTATPAAAEAAADTAATAATADTAATAATAAASHPEPGSSGGSSNVKVMYLRKAQGLVAELGLRFGREDGRFAWSDADKLSADSGPVLPAILQHLGLIKYSPSLQATLQQHQQELPAGPEERTLRAAAVAAVDAIAAQVSSSAAGPTARELSNYLLSRVQEEESSGQLLFEGAVLSTHVTRGTTAY